MKRIILASCLGLVACGQEGDGPLVPEPLTQSPSGDAEGAQMPAGSDDSSSRDPRLTTLPAALKAKLLSCEAEHHFYDLGSQTCTTLEPAPFPCVIDDALKALLDPSTLQPLDDYLATKARGQTLYSCTVDEQNLSLHFYKFENGIIQYRKLNIAKRL